MTGAGVRPPASCRARETGGGRGAARDGRGRPEGAAGLPGDTPALLAEAVSTPAQRLHRTTIAALAEEMAQDPGDAAALILYGPLAGGDDA